MTATQTDLGDQLPRLLDITHLAELLGVTPRHIRRLVFERRIPFIKWGHLIRFDPDDIATWLHAARCPEGAHGPARDVEKPAPTAPPTRRRPPAQAKPRHPQPALPLDDALESDPAA